MDVLKNPNRDLRKKIKKHSCALCKAHKMGWGRNEKRQKYRPAVNAE